MTRLLTLLFACLFTSTLASAHHSTVAIYDGSQVAEIGGTVKSVSWRNPHGRIILEVEEAGDIVEWRIETPSIGVLRNSGVTDVSIEVGDSIMIAGSPSRRGQPELAARNVLLSSGIEIAFLAAETHFAAGLEGNLVGRGFDQSEVEEAIASADGFFRVWSTIMSDPAAFPMFKGGYPLTEAAEAVVDQWQPLDNDLLMCGTKGMPLIMITPLPVDFTEIGDEILMRIEEYDVRRTIHMAEDAVAPPGEYTQFGFSRGHWEGRTLVVVTDHIQEQYFDPDGVPQSEDMVTIERFMPNEAYDRMDYTINITDPVYFTESFDLSRYFVWFPEMKVSPYECLERDFN
jgi:hypothetical protein